MTMAETTDIEKKSLEAHVELCAERYKLLEIKLESVEEKITTVASSVETVKKAVQSMANRNNDRLINWAIGIFVALLSTVAWMLQHYVLT